jgi:hypothetical protein
LLTQAYFGPELVDEPLPVLHDEPSPDLRG